MCGVLVFISDSGRAGERQAAVTAALESMHHRGPDDTGTELVDQDVIFAHKRLAIIDVEFSKEPLSYPPLTAGTAVPVQPSAALADVRWSGAPTGGYQPRHASRLEPGRYTLTLNGEIYNYIELRRELQQQFGAEFATQGDAEVIVAGYHYWGEAVLDKLRGMFAFIIWDKQQRKAFGARDPFGIKPLHYLRTGDGLYLASEKKALLPFLPVERDGSRPLHAPSLSHYLTLQYVPEPDTLHCGIRRLGSGECFTYSPGGEIKIRRYWRAKFRPTKVSDPDRLYRKIQDTLRESVRMHMRADVPVGAFLSSGIDSTAIVALSREFNPKILTFTVGFDVEGYSEIDIAQQSARALNVTTIPTKIGPQDMMNALPKIVWHLDDPVADPSLVPLYFLAKKASEYVTVVLSGEGSDEFFGGYTIYREPLSLAAVNALPAPLQRGLRAVSRAIPEGVKGKSFLERGTTPLEERYYGNARIFTEEDKRTLLRHYDPNVRYTDVTAPLYAEAAGLDPVTTMQYIDLYTWLRGDILVKADRISMAHSLELRVPFLDKEVFAVAAELPVDQKLPPRSDATKYALRRALEGIVPPEIVNRRKLGFPTPTRVWLKGEMYEWARDILTHSGAGHLLNLKYVIDLLEAHRRGDADHSRPVWTVLVFCVWYAIFVDGTLDPGITRAQSALLTKPVVGSVVS